MQQLNCFSSCIECGAVFLKPYILSTSMPHNLGTKTVLINWYVAIGSTINCYYLFILIFEDESEETSSQKFVLKSTTLWMDLFTLK